MTRKRMPVLVAIAVVLVVQFSLASETAWAQAGTLGNIMGRAADETGGVLPGVTVTATSPALQVPSATTVTDAEGNYRLRDLPAPGMYRVVFELPGFQTVAFDGVSLTAGFTARLDPAMKVSTVSETVEVSGQSPVVDTVSVAGVSSITLERLESIPLGSGIQNLLPLAAGVSLQGVPDVGDSQLANRQRTVTYGVPLTPTLEFEGINSTTARQGNTALYLNSFQVEEASFKTTGNNADVAVGGVHQQLIMKSGGNAFHGSTQGSYENKAWQGNNVTSTLRGQGFTITNPINYYFDWNADFGGYIVRNKLWFYGGASSQKISQYQIAFVKAPNAQGCWTCPDAEPGEFIRVLDQAYSKFHWQISPSNRLIGTFVRAEKKSPFFGANATTPAPTTRVQSQPTRTWKVGSQNTLNNNLLIDSVFGFCCYWTHYTPQPGTAVAGNPASQEITNNLLTGPLGAIPGTVSERYQARSSVSYSTGRHQVKVGVDLNWERQDSTRPKEYPSGSYTLLFNRGVPTELRTYNTPTNPVDREYGQAAYATDTWSLGRVTLSYGVRWERYHNFIPEQTKEAGQFSSAQTFPAIDVLTWKGVVPRVGMNWDVTGDGKTSLKAFFGVFGDTMGADFASTYNPNAEVTTRYRWSGPCVVTPFRNVSYNLPNTSCDYLPGSVDLSTGPGARDYISATGGSNSLLNPNLKQNKNYETSVRFDRQLVPNVGVGFGYVYNRHVNWYGSVGGSNTVDGVNVGRPYAVWNVPVVLTDPFDGRQVTLYTYPAAYRGAAFNQNQRLNAPSDRPDYYHSFEMTLNKRFSRRWNMSSSFWMTKSHEWVAANPSNPNDDAFPVRDYWTWEARADASYRLPADINVHGNLRAASGALGQRTQTFSDARLNQGTVTLRMEPYGSQEGPVVPITSLRVGKKFRTAGRYAVDVVFSVFNVTNSSAAVSTSYLSGTFGRITDILPPRVARLGMEFSF
jgi:Carboxypeptidase regulatory-like domain